GGATALAMFLFGLLPALRGSRADLHDALKVGGRGMAASSAGRAIGNALVIGQVALALILLVGAGLMIRSLQELIAVDLGFEPAGMFTMTFNLPQTRYPDRAASTDFFNRLETRLTALPGVESLGSTSVVPLSGGNSDVDFNIEGRPRPGPGEETAVWYRRVTPTYFATMGIRIVRGRGFTTGDDQQAPTVTIINQTLADRFFPDEDPIGKRLNVNNRENPVWREIVGIAEDIKNFGVQNDSRDATYFPFAQLPTSFMAVVVRTAGDPALLIPAARAAIAELDPNLAASNVTTLDAMVQASLGSERFVTLLLTLFAAVAFVLAAVGLYGVVSYGVTRRVHEMGLRLALGAAHGDIRKLIIGNSVMLAGAGVGVGIVGGLLLTRVMGGLLFGVRATDPVTFAVTAVLLTGVAVLASALPAQRAVKVDPMAVLKNE
ncbi:MAG: ABC transporter permease, partial [Gemmatimonadales bacterium]